MKKPKIQKEIIYKIDSELDKLRHNWYDLCVKKISKKIAADKLEHTKYFESPIIVQNLIKSFQLCQVSEYLIFSRPNNRELFKDIMDILLPKMGGKDKKKIAEYTHNYLEQKKDPSAQSMSLALDVGANIYNKKDHSTDSIIIVFRLIPLLALYTYLVIAKNLSDKQIYNRLKIKIDNLIQNPIVDSNPIRLLEIYINLFFDHYYEDFHFDINDMKI